MATLRSYATLDNLRLRQGSASTDTSDNARLLAKLRSATANVEQYTGRNFEPIYGTNTFDYEDSHSLNFRSQTLLSLTSVVDGLSSTITPSAIILLGGTASSNTSIAGPYYGFEIDVASGAYLGYLTTKKRTILVTGYWGWHDDYASAWHNSSDTVSGSLTASATTFTVTNAAGSDEWGLSPRFSAGQLVAIDYGLATQEYVRVLAVSTNTLAVRRGENGTTAQVHSSSATLYSYLPPADIADCTLRWAAYLFAQDSADFSTRFIPSAGGVTVPAGVPRDIYEILDGYKVYRVA